MAVSFKTVTSDKLQCSMSQKTVTLTGIQYTHLQDVLLRSITAAYSHLCLDLPVVSYSKVLSTTILYVLVVSPHRSTLTPNSDSSTFFPVASSPNRAQTVPLLRFLDHTQPAELRCTNEQLVAKVATYATRNKHKRRTSTSLSGIRTHDPSNLAAANLRLRPQGHRNQIPPSLHRLNNRKQAGLFMSAVRSM